ncbi:hypothetical protein ACLI08_04970 [Flavobacterium sp. RNTU_13]|uniref:hypothetical protein n=1 Tax=Flavobacterium sp. RNTU_13 TaxID=3375145 RepID=UPI0039889915
MPKSFIIFLTKLTSALTLFLFFGSAGAQENDFLKKVQFGGGLGVGFGSGYTDVNVSPGAIYHINDYLALGPSLQFSYTYQRNWYKNMLYGGSAVVLVNPVPAIQLSAELQQLRVNQKFDINDLGIYPPGITTYNTTRDFWNTALFVGVGYSIDRGTIGFRYNVLYNKNDFIYGDALMPFVRVYF